VKAASLLADLLSLVVLLWSEIPGMTHPPVRCLIDNSTAKKQMDSGAGTMSSSSYLKYKRHCESKVYAGLLWFDLVPGAVNIADVGTRQVRDTQEFFAPPYVRTVC